MPNILERASVMGTNQSKAVTRVMSRIEESNRAFGGQNARFRALNRLYLGLSAPVQARDNDRAVISGRNEGREMFVPKSLEIIEGVLPQWVLSHFGRKPYTRLMGKTEDDHNNADAVETMLHHDMTQAEVLLEAISIGRSGLKFGTGIGKVVYRYDSHMHKKRVQEEVPDGFDMLRRLLTRTEKRVEKEAVVDFDGPFLEWISTFNFGVDPLYWRWRDMRYCWERRWTDRDTLDYRNEQHRKLTKGKNLYKNLDKIPLMPRSFAERAYEVDPSDDTSELMGWTQFGGWKRQSYSQVKDVDEDRDRAVEILEFWDRYENKRYEIANGSVAIYEGENPYDDGDFPYVKFCPIDLEGYFWGMGYLHIVETLQEELNNHRMLLYKQAQQNVANIWAIDESVDLPEQGIEVDPGDVIQVPFYASGKPALTPMLQGRPIPPEGYAIQDMIVGDMERGTASSALRTGGGQAKGVDTATEAKMISMGEERRVQLVSLVSEETFVVRMAKKFISRRQQYFKEEQVFRIIGKKAVEFKRLSPTEIAGQFDLEPRGMQTFMSKEVLRQQILQQLSLTQNPQVGQVSDVYEQVREWWAQSDFPNPERFVVPPPEKTVDPHKENIVMLHGEWEDVVPSEPHEQHIQVHQQALEQADTMEAMMRLQQHIQEHQRYVKPTQGAGPGSPQEQPGLKGYAGNVPNPGNQGPESAGGIAARVNAGPGV